MPTSFARTPDEFFTWLGKCITAWAKVEEHLFEICVSSLQCTKPRAAIVYFRTPTLEARLKLVDELVRTVLPKRRKKDGNHDHPDVKSWDIVRKEIFAAIPIRNRLAHHPVASKQIRPKPTDPKDAVAIAVSDLLTHSWYESYVSEGERLRGRHDDVKPLTSPDLSAHRVAVEEIITRLTLWRSHVLAKYIK